MGVEGQGPGRPGQQGHHKVGCGTQGRACFIGALRKGQRTAHLPHFSALPPTRVRVWEGWGAQRKAEMTHIQGLATRDLHEGGHLGSEATRGWQR